MADTHGNVLTLGERDCSLQRRNQKVIEESPCPALTEEQRQGLYKAAADAARAVQYIGAGTIEFLLDSTGEFYFMEMNTRIQVEHPVTEMVTGIDLIQTQIRVAGGEALSLRQEDVRIQGHAVECRINAEDPAMQFRPAAGTVEALHLAGGFGVRNDFFIYQDYKVPHCYDSMLGKIIVWGETRAEALNRMKRVLDETIISGLKTNLEFQKSLIELEDFQSGEFHTGTLEASLDDLILTMNQKLKGA